MMKKMVELVASAGFVLATFAGAQSASAQQTISCYAPRDVQSTDQVTWTCEGLSVSLQTGLQDATVTTTVQSIPFVPKKKIPHDIHIKVKCSHGTSASNQQAFSVSDNSDTATCPNNEYVQHVVAWVTVNPDGAGQGGSDGEGQGGSDGEDQGGDEGGDEGGDQGGDEGGDEGGE